MKILGKLIKIKISIFKMINKNETTGAIMKEDDTMKKNG